MISGLFIGIIFGIILKRSRLCLTGIIRDIYLEKRYYNLVILFAIIFFQSTLYFLLRKLNVLPEIFIFDFSFLAASIGGLLFGIGAVLSSGCLTSTLLKNGDGRLVSFFTLLGFIISSYICIKGFLKPIVLKLYGVFIIPEESLWKLPFSPFVISIIVSIVLIIFMIRHHIKFKPKFKIPSRHTGVRYVFCEKIWSKEISAILISVLAVLSYYVSNFIGRNGSFSISIPIISWVNFICPIDTAGFG